MNKIILLLMASFLTIITPAGVLAATETKVSASDKVSGDGFGFSVGINGDYAIIGSKFQDSGGSNAGAAYIFRRTGENTWDAGTKLVASDPEAGDYFGCSVAIAGDYAIVGASNEGTGGIAAGAAYIFQRTGVNTWSAATKIMSSDLQAMDGFGWSVAISGNYAVVGAKYEDEGGTNAGAAYVFLRTAGNTWDAGTKLLSSDIADSDSFGTFVGISGDYAIVGANLEDEGGSSAGAAYIFRRTDTNTWDAGTKILASDAQANDNFGSSVGIFGDYAIVGAYGESTGGASSGAAYIYHRTGENTWDAGTKIVAGDPEANDYFGYAVSICDPYALVGAYSEDTGASAVGAVYFFRRTMENTWDTGTKITPSDGEANDNYGYAVAIYDYYGVSGSYNEDPGSLSNAGSAYMIKHDLPAGVDLLAFEAEWTDAGAALSWLTGSETECGAFTILRCELGDLWNGCALDEYQELDLVIPCADSLYGGEYEALDVTADPDVNYAYLLREYETTGGVNEYGPVFLNSLKYGNAQPDGEVEAPGDDDAAELPEDDAEASDDDESGESAAVSEDAEEDDAGCGI